MRFFVWVMMLCGTSAQHLFCQGPGIQWQRTYGGNMGEGLFSVVNAQGGGYLFGGYSSSGISGEKTDSCRGYEDYWIVRTDDFGNILWDKTYGGDSTDFLQRIVPVSSGGYLLIGYSVSGISGEKTDTAYGYWDTWIVRIDSSGTKLWDRSYGGSGNYTDGAVAGMQMADGNFLIWIVSASGPNSIKTDNCRGSSDYWILKTDTSGNILWQKTIGGNGIDHILSVTETLDGGLALGGFSWSGISGDKTTVCYGGFDYWLVKLDGSGNIQWQQEYGGSSFEHLISLQQLPDSGYMMAGFSQSGVSGNKTEASRGMYDYWILRTDAIGNILWQKAYGGNMAEEMRGGALSTADGGCLLTGFSQSGISFEKTEPNRGMDDFWVVKINASGTLVWDKTFGGDSTEFIYTSLQSPDGGFLLAGWSRSGISGDKTDACRGGFDFWVVKTYPDPSGMPGFSPNDPVVLVFPNPFSNTATIRINRVFRHGDSFRLAIYDTGGKQRELIRGISQPEIIISKKDLKNGAYFFRLESENGTGEVFTGNFIVSD